MINGELRSHLGDLWIEFRTGGIGTIEGPIVGTLIYVLLSQWLAEYGHVSLLIMGIVAIAIILMAPKGIVGTLKEKTGFEVISLRRTA